MTGEVASIFVRLSANTDSFENSMRSAKEQMSSMEKTTAAVGSAMKAAFAVGATAVAGMGVAVVKTGLDFLAMKEQADIAFTTMLGSGTAAQGMLDELQAFAAKTPFEFPDLIRASQRMMAMGFASQEVIPTLTAVGDAVAALGGGQYEIDRVTTALGQMNAKGKTSAEEMMQLTEAGIPAWQMLADKIGVSVPEAMKMVTKGAVDARTTIDAVVSGVEQRFGGMMAAQSTTWNGLFSNLKDNFALISGTLMGPFFEIAKQGLEKLVAASDAFFAVIKEGKSPFLAFRQALSELLPAEMLARWDTFQLQLQYGYEALRTILTPIVEVIGKFVTWKDVLASLGILAVVSLLGTLVAALAPIISTIALVTAAVATLRWAWQNDFGGIKTFTQRTLETLTRWFKDESGLWHGSWEKTMQHFSKWAKSGWKTDILIPIQGHLFAMKGAIFAWANGAMVRFSDWLLEAKHTFSSGLSVIVHNFNSWKNDAISAITHWASVTGDKVSDWIQMRKQDISRFVTEWGTKIKEWKDNMIDRLKETFAWFKPNEWIQKGRDTIQGLWDGAKAVWQSFKDWWRGIWDTLTGTVDVKLRIGSPSKEMFDRGAWAVEGFADGAKKMMPTAIGAMDGLAYGAMGAGSYAAAGAANGTPAVSTSRIEELLVLLIQELRAKNMNVTVNGGGENYGNLVAFTAGGRG